MSPQHPEYEDIPLKHPKCNFAISMILRSMAILEISPNCSAAFLHYILIAYSLPKPAKSGRESFENLPRKNPHPVNLEASHRHCVKSEGICSYSSSFFSFICGSPVILLVLFINSPSLILRASSVAGLTDSHILIPPDRVYLMRF